MRKMAWFVGILIGLIVAWFLAYTAGSHTGVERHGPLAPYTDTRGGPSPAGAR